MLFFYICRFVRFAAHRYQLNNTVREAVTQMAQLTSNIRVFYSVHYTDPIPSIQKMVEMGALPISLFKDQIIANPFGGQIVIEQSKPFRYKKNNTLMATFKISYQGLSHEACVRLATINWGGSEQGLVAMAAGIVKSDGTDTALKDIDDNFSTQQTFEKKNTEGKKRTIHAAVHYKMNVAKPENNFSPVPFSEEAAHVACECEQYENCSFALNYTLDGYIGKQN